MSTPPKHHSPAFLALVNEARKRIREINIEQYQEMKTQPHLLVDVREDTEWSVAHAAGAIHLGKGVIERDVEARVPDKSTTLVLYCGGGFRSALAADALRQMGYTNAISLNGGWRAWQNAGLPVEK
ncbi:MAG TPA: rhodanese-like domain-containing protein [Bryobacteraceae bacterium]|jgi:rhodanese-related sulfurtransferase|nr:rhodanese-like domain-containing protein [Bryobacteraceae bacterium]